MDILISVSVQDVSVEEAESVKDYFGWFLEDIEGDGLSPISSFTYTQREVLVEGDLELSRAGSVYSITQSSVKVADCYDEGVARKIYKLMEEEDGSST